MKRRVEKTILPNIQERNNGTEPRYRVRFRNYKWQTHNTLEDARNALGELQASFELQQNKLAEAFELKKKLLAKAFQPTLWGEALKLLDKHCGYAMASGADEWEARKTLSLKLAKLAADYANGL